MEDMSLKLPTEIVERAVRDKINAAIATELGDPTELITRMVASALSQKVNDKGVVGKYSSENKFSFLDAIAGEFIRETAKEALKEYFQDNKQQIKASVKKEVAKSSSNLARVFMDGIEEGMRSSYLSTIKINFTTSND